MKTRTTSPDDPVHDEEQQAEEARIVAELKDADRKEEKAWGIKTDLTAFGRKRINLPDRW